MHYILNLATSKVILPFFARVGSVDLKKDLEWEIKFYSLYFLFCSNALRILFFRCFTKLLNVAPVSVKM